MRTEFSAALCRGLIEADQPTSRHIAISACFPRLYAAASLKLANTRERMLAWFTFSAALCRGLIEARSGACARRSGRHRFPRLYAAASLKPRLVA